MFPRTPRVKTQPLFVALRAFFQKEGGGMRANPWIDPSMHHKSLIVEQNLLAGWVRFSTGRGIFSTGCTISSTGAFFAFSVYIYLSLLKEERRKESIHGKGAQIHGLEKLLKNASTGFDPYPRVFRGCSWIMIIIKSDSYIRFMGYPRLHRWKCVWCLGHLPVRT